jgi:hypothetical protein
VALDWVDSLLGDKADPAIQEVLDAAADIPSQKSKADERKAAQDQIQALRSRINVMHQEAARGQG